jgi:hypothetical protein
MIKATQKVEAAAEALEAKHGNNADATVTYDLGRFISNCRAVAYGTYVWSRNTPRYAMIHSLRAEDGSISFTVGEPATMPPATATDSAPAAAATAATTSA